MAIAENLEDEEQPFWKEDQIRKYCSLLSVYVEDGPKTKHKRTIDSLQNLHAAWNTRLDFHMTVGEQYEIFQESGKKKVGFFLMSKVEAVDVYNELKGSSENKVCRSQINFIG